jgi:hypothetical protein
MELLRSTTPCIVRVARVVPQAECCDLETYMEMQNEKQQGI